MRVTNDASISSYFKKLISFSFFFYRKTRLVKYMCDLEKLPDNEQEFEQELLAQEWNKKLLRLKELEEKSRGIKPTKEQEDEINKLKEFKEKIKYKATLKSVENLYIGII